MKNSFRIELLVAVFVLLALLGCGQVKQNKVDKESRENRVCLKGNCFYVELAATPIERARGLMFRKHLDYNKGMLFLFEDEQRHSFHMKNTLIPLDMVWINREKEVVFIKQDAQPCKKNPCPSIYPDRDAMYVLELNAGAVADMGLELGDKVKFQLYPAREGSSLTGFTQGLSCFLINIGNKLNKGILS